MKVERGQSIWDIAIQKAGTVEAAIELATQNEIALTDDLAAEQELTTYSETQNEILQSYFSGKVINSHVNSSPVDERAGGIGYMGIQIDFIVS